MFSVFFVKSVVCVGDEGKDKLVVIVLENIDYKLSILWSLELYCSFYIVVYYFVVHRFTVVPLCLPCVVYMFLFKTAACVGGETKNKNLVRGYCYGKSFWYNIYIYPLRFELFSFLRIPLSTIRYFMSFLRVFWWFIFFFFE